MTIPSFSSTPRGALAGMVSAGPALPVHAAAAARDDTLMKGATIRYHTARVGDPVAARLPHIGP
jgi:hypothetical protein